MQCDPPVLQLELHLVDGDQDVVDGGVSGLLRPPQVDGELLEGVVAVGGQVVLTGSWELERVSVEGLEVAAAPGAADAAHMVLSWGRTSGDSVSGV